MKKLRVFYSSFVFPILLLASCGQPSDSCTPETETIPITVELLAGNQDMPSRFPLEEYVVGYFNVRDSSGVFTGKYHAAEDYYVPAGTPVYAVADGVISFSGPMAGYGWLIIIDHPQADIYSLYGHLSPSRWTREPGNVEKGELIAYIGDSDENGSSAKYGTFEPHLHFGVRLGQRIDYPRSGDYRWQAGWTYACPESIGWLQPSQFIVDYAEGSFIPSNVPYKVTRIVYISYILGGLWIAGLGCIMLLGILMSRRLKKSNIVTNSLIKRVMPWANIAQYKQVTMQETGNPGPLYYSFLVCVFLTSLAAIGLVTVLMILR